MRIHHRELMGRDLLAEGRQHPLSHWVLTPRRASWAKLARYRMAAPLPASWNKTARKLSRRVRVAR